MRYTVIAIDKCTKQVTKSLATMTDEKKAESFCEAWGWNFCDETGKSYWLDYMIEN